jgi:hypothetical protein
MTGTSRSLDATQARARLTHEMVLPSDDRLRCPRPACTLRNTTAAGFSQADVTNQKSRWLSRQSLAKSARHPCHDQQMPTCTYT